MFFKHFRHLAGGSDRACLVLSFPYLPIRDLLANIFAACHVVYFPTAFVVQEPQKRCFEVKRMMFNGRCDVCERELSFMAMWQNPHGLHVYFFDATLAGNEKTHSLTCNGGFLLLVNDALWRSLPHGSCIRLLHLHASDTVC